MSSLVLVVCLFLSKRVASSLSHFPMRLWPLLLCHSLFSALLISSSDPTSFISLPSSHLLFSVTRQPPPSHPPPLAPSHPSDHPSSSPHPLCLLLLSPFLRKTQRAFILLAQPLVPSPLSPLLLHPLSSQTPSPLSSPKTFAILSCTCSLASLLLSPFFALRPPPPSHLSSLSLLFFLLYPLLSFLLLLNFPFLFPPSSYPLSPLLDSSLFLLLSHRRLFSQLLAWSLYTALLQRQPTLFRLALLHLASPSSFRIAPSP